jgi:glutamate--cysteine ligase
MSEQIYGKEDLIRYFQSGAKPRSQWRVGTEFEKIAVDGRTGRALPFSGPHGVESLLKRLADRFGWEPEDEHGRILALRGKKSSITIEPGGQIELSGEQCETIHCTYAEFTEHIDQLTEVGREHGVALLGLGMQPMSKLDEIELLPKARYRIMFPYMARKGRLGQRMMKQTAGVQANLDYGDETDAMRKFRVSMGIVPIVCRCIS